MKKFLSSLVMIILFSSCAVEKKKLTEPFERIYTQSISHFTLHPYYSTCIYRNGIGKWTHTYGDHYEGDFVQEKRHGRGVYKWENGDEYTGEFVDDSRHGKVRYFGIPGLIFLFLFFRMV